MLKCFYDTQMWTAGIWVQQLVGRTSANHTGQQSFPTFMKIHLSYPPAAPLFTLQVNWDKEEYIYAVDLYIASQQDWVPQAHTVFLLILTWEH